MRALLAAFGSVIALGAVAPGSASAQDAAAGERIFLQCRTCHQIGETARNAVGPHLNGLFDNRNKGSVAGYSYSAAYQNIKDQVWTVENFTTYIKDPRGVTPGTKMVYAGLKNEDQIKNLVTYLQQFGPDGKRK
jgi:cytochrome c